VGGGTAGPPKPRKEISLTKTANETTPNKSKDTPPLKRKAVVEDEDSEEDDVPLTARVPAKKAKTGGGNFWPCIGSRACI
jgi:hypothetical protein